MNNSQNLRQLSSLDLGPSLAPGGVESDGEAMTALVNAMTLAAAPVNEYAVKELMMIELYGGAFGRSIVERVLMLKIRQAPGSLRRLERIGNALSMKEFMSRINLNIGGK